MLQNKVSKIEEYYIEYTDTIIKNSVLKTVYNFDENGYLVEKKTTNLLGVMSSIKYNYDKEGKIFTIDTIGFALGISGSSNDTINESICTEQIYVKGERKILHSFQLFPSDSISNEKWFKYNKYGNVIQEKEVQINNGKEVINVTSIYSYNDNGLLERIRSSSESNNIFEIRYVYYQ